MGSLDGIAILACSGKGMASRRKLSRCTLAWKSCDKKRPHAVLREGGLSFD
jgi:hypothetical protein